MHKICLALAAVVLALTALHGEGLAQSAPAPGTPVWQIVQQPDEEGASSQGRGVALDNEGNLLVTGFIEAADGNYDIATYKHSPQGDLIWSRRYDYSWYDVGCAVASDARGNVIVAGASQDPDNPIDIYLKTYYTDYVLLKYSPDGELLFDVTASGNDKNNEPSGVCVDSSGAIYATGSAKDASDTRDVFYTVKFGPDGVLDWERFEDWSAQGEATGIAVSPEGIAITGFAWNPDQQNYDIKTFVYSPQDGSVLEYETFRAEGHYFDEKAYALAVDAEGYVYIAGGTSDEDGVTLTLRLGPDLNPVWSEPIYILDRRNYGRAVDVDEHGRVFVAARVDVKGFMGGLQLLVYGPDGQLIDTREVGLEKEFTVEDMVVEPDGDIVVVGTSFEEDGPAMMTTVRLAGYPSVSVRSFDLEQEFVHSEKLKLSVPASPMLRKVSLDMTTVMLYGCLPATVFKAEPIGMPGEYEYRFSVTRGEGLDWVTVRDYSPISSWTMAPRVGSNPITGVMVEVRPLGSTMDYQAREYIYLEGE